jgi:hypothetical protein
MIVIFRASAVEADSGAILPLFFPLLVPCYFLKNQSQ